VLVYTCKNQNCQQYLIGGIALCKVISAEGVECYLDSEESTYKTPEDAVFSGKASCFHCKRKASKIEFKPEEVNPDSIGRVIDELDEEIDSVMKMLGVEE
jgi:hypothetical protein